MNNGLTLKPRPHAHHGCVSDIIQVRERWIRRVTFSPDMREARARINLRNKTRREPSASEVQAYMVTDQAQVTFKVVSAAFRSGKEVRHSIGYLHDYGLQRVSRN